MFEEFMLGEFMLEKLEEAISEGNTSKVKDIAKDMDESEANYIGRYNETALYKIISSGNPEGAEALIGKMDASALENANDQGFTALHIAASFGFLGVCSRLIERIGIPDGNDSKAFKLAEVKGHAQIRDLLKYGANSEYFVHSDSNIDLNGEVLDNGTLEDF